MGKFILIAILICAETFLNAQNKLDSLGARPSTSVYLNLFGDASIISFNYERQFIISSAFILTGKLGLGYNEEYQLCLFGGCPPPEKYITIPHHITGMLGKRRHFFEFGIGGTIVNGVTTQPYLLYPIVGYRFLPLRSNKINFRVFGEIPFTGEPDDILFMPWGISVGVSF